MCLQDEIGELMDGNMWQYLKSSTNKRLETVRLHLDQHEEIVRAICLHNPDQAKEAMRNHLQNIDENMEDLLSSYQDTPRDKH
jgi:DNA-binding FadR family transcriptional regulator